MTDYKGLYQTKCGEYDELLEQYGQLQEQTNMIINDLEEQLKESKRKNQQLNREINEHKEKSKCFKSSIEREVELAQKERNQFKKKFIEFEKKVIELEIVNESLESELRATKARLSEYESQIQKTMEELALAQLEMEETNENNKETVARLKGQLKEAEEQLYALHQIKQKVEQPAPPPKEEPFGLSEIGTSEMLGTQKQLFRETLKGIRDYLDNLQTRKAQARKMVAKLCSQ